MEFPKELAEDTERFRVSHMNVEEIPKHAFSYLPNITLIEFEQSNVGRIAGCAFKDMYSLKKLTFDKVVVGSIESFAFNGLNELQQIEFSKSRIGRLKSFAFYQITEVVYFNFKETNIEYFYSNAFTRVQNVSTMLFASNNISDVVTSAFREVNVRGIEIKSNTFWNVHCGVLGEISRSHIDSFVFNFNSFYCNCSISNMIDTYGREKFKTIISENTCHGPKPFMSITSLKAMDLGELHCKIPITDDPVKCKEIKLRIVNPSCSGSTAAGAGSDDENQIGQKLGASYYGHNTFFTTTGAVLLLAKLL